MTDPTYRVVFFKGPRVESVDVAAACAQLDEPPTVEIPRETCAEVAAAYRRQWRSDHG